MSPPLHWLHQAVSCSVQIVVKTADVPSLDARDANGAVSHITFSADAPHMASMAHGLSSVSPKELTTWVLGHWHSQCDMLLSDETAMAQIQVGSTSTLPAVLLLQRASSKCNHLKASIELSCVPYSMQERKPDVIVGIIVFACTPLLAAKLGVPYITVTPGAVFIPSFIQPLYPDSGRHMHIPDRLSYSPEIQLAGSSLPMVSNLFNHSSSITV